MDSKSFSERLDWQDDNRDVPMRAPLRGDSSIICDLQITAPSARDESRLFDLIGRIDHKVLQGVSFYIQVHGIAYKVLYGVYWRSVYSGQQFWGLRCQEIERGMWAGEDPDTNCIDLPISYTDEGWAVEEQSLQFLLNRDLPLFENSFS